jgi:hypothetical protein
VSQLFLIDFSCFLLSAGEWTRQAVTILAMTITLDDDITLPFDDEEKRCRAEAIERAKAAFEEAGRAQLKVLDRGVRTQILGVRHLLPVKGRRRARHRPQSADTLLLRDEVAQFVIYAGVAHPEWSRKETIRRVKDLFGVERAYMFRALQRLDPERRANMEASARALFHR